MTNRTGRFRISPLGIIAFLVVFFVVSLLLIIVPTSFTATGVLRFPPEGFSLQWYAKILDRPEFIESFWVSLKLAAVTAVLATFIGTLAAFALHKYKPPGSGALNALLLSPLTVHRSLSASRRWRSSPGRLSGCTRGPLRTAASRSMWARSPGASAPT
ncbi:hypothetical protein J6TS7_00040 [Paenibacillus dendritiformis]|nr:hypothetical protein J6TS7_00040 [Paenibacillus dendritiformis]